MKKGAEEQGDMADSRCDIESTSNRPDDDSGFDRTADRPNEGKPIRRKDILNILNFVNFQGGVIYVHFRHKKFDTALTLQAVPRPCESETLECRWRRPEISVERLRDYDFDCFHLSDGQELYQVKADIAAMDEQRIVFKIPDFGHEKSDRKIRRFPCENIRAWLLQNGVKLGGVLVDFNAVSCRIELVDADYQSIRRINPDFPISMILEKNKTILFSGDCSITRIEGSGTERTLVLTPTTNNIRRYRAREFRCSRHVLNPTPNIRFTHPLTGKLMHLQASDISSSGLSVEEFFHNSTLLPGLLIPELSFEIGNHFMVKGQAQVLYRNIEKATDSGEPLARCGMVFLDMDISDQAELSAILQQSANNRMRVCNQVDMEELWRFFFETGFIYPSKYISIESYKDDFKRTYEKLYLDSPAIARHFIYQDKGVIFGHMSMIHNYANTWLLHHHAADRSGYGMAGVAVLDQAGQYANAFHMHHSTHMEYVMCYYRKENRFPSRVFGGVTQDIDDLKGSSIDPFAYLNLPKLESRSEEAYQILPVHADDLIELSRSYGSSSGGLALDALNLTSTPLPERELDFSYEKHGFHRSRVTFALKQAGQLKAVIMLSLSDLGLNLSNLTNCVHAFVIDEENLLPKTLLSGITDICEHYEKLEIPLLVYPSSYMDEHKVEYDKKYILWVLDLNHLDGYFKSLRGTFRRGELGSDQGRSRKG